VAAAHDARVEGSDTFTATIALFRYAFDVAHVAATDQRSSVPAPMIARIVEVLHPLQIWLF
jgi:hypothetical protein